MAANFPVAGSIKLKPRKGHDVSWSCDKHAEPIKFYCKDHKIPICHPCATKDHKPCQLDDIEDVILEMRTKLDNKQSELDEMLQCLKRLNSAIESCSTFMSNHLETINAEVSIAYEGKIKSVETKKQKDILQINEEADGEIRKINEKIQIINEERERRIESCIAEAEKQHQTLKETQAQIISESKKINMMAEEKMADLKSKNQHSIDTIANVDSKIERIRQDDKTLLNEAHQVITISDESLNVHHDIDACLVQIQGEVERVKFVQGEIGGKQFTRIDGYYGKWDRTKSFPLPSTIKSPFVCGLIGDDEICVTDVKNNDFYISNISNGHTNKVLKGDSNSCVTTCARINSDFIVCGKWRDDYKVNILDGRITIYDSQWKVVRDITIPRSPSTTNKFLSFTVYVDVDKDGMILAAQNGQSNIYVINHADGKIVNTIMMQGKEVYGNIKALLSGDIFVQTNANKFTLISRSGEEKATIQHDDWKWAWCCIDKLTDTLYITHTEAKRVIRHVDQVSRDGDIQAKSIANYVFLYTTFLGFQNPSTFTPAGYLIACDGDNILVNKKSFLL